MTRQPIMATSHRILYPPRSTLITVVFDQRSRRYLELGDLKAIVRQFHFIGDMAYRLYSFPRFYKRTFVPIETAWNWVELYRKANYLDKARELESLISWAETIDEETGKADV